MARAGTEFDPEVVDAAAAIVAAEGTMTRSADFEPTPAPPAASGARSAAAVCRRSAPVSAPSA